MMLSGPGSELTSASPSDVEELLRRMLREYADGDGDRTGDGLGDGDLLELLSRVGEVGEVGDIGGDCGLGD